MVSQWPPVLPEWLNLVQFGFQQKHPVPARDSPLRRESSTKCAHGVVMHHTGGFQQSDQKAAVGSGPVKLSQTRPIPRSPDGDDNMASLTQIWIDIVFIFQLRSSAEF